MDEQEREKKWKWEQRKQFISLLYRPKSKKNGWLIFVRAISIIIRVQQFCSKEMDLSVFNLSKKSMSNEAAFIFRKMIKRKQHTHTHTHTTIILSVFDFEFYAFNPISNYACIQFLLLNALK